MIFVWTLFITYGIACLGMLFLVILSWPVLEHICKDKIMSPQTAAVLLVLFWPLVIYYVLQERSNKKKVV